MATNGIVMDFKNSKNASNIYGACKFNFMKFSFHYTYLYIAEFSKKALSMLEKLEYRLE